MKKSQKVFLTILLCIATLATLSLTAFAEITSGDSFPPSDQRIEFGQYPYTQPPTITMLKENGGLLFTTLLIGIALGIGGTLLVQHIRRKKKQ